MIESNQLQARRLKKRLVVQWASSEGEVREAQGLRYRVFAQEQGAQLEPQNSAAMHEDLGGAHWRCANVGSATASGAKAGSADDGFAANVKCSGQPIDADRFDPFCDHLLVRALEVGSDDYGVLVGTYRVLPPLAAKNAGGLYIDTEFDIASLQQLRSKAVELGRSCVDPEWRSGAVIMTLWSALCGYMQTRQLETMIGCASVGLGDGGRTAFEVWQGLAQSHLVAPQWRVRPLQPWKGAIGTSPSSSAAPAKTPPLIKGYLRCGARLLGPPALDPAFNTADLPMMLRIDDLTPRYQKRFAHV